MAIALIGDTHGVVEAAQAVLNELEKVPQVKTAIQVGDLGFYSGTIPRWQRLRTSKDFYWIPGNHEDHDRLPHDRTEVVEMWPHFYFIPNGTVLELDGRKIAFVGGASSVDKEIRIRQRMDWSPKEVITEAQMARLDNVGKVDMLVTHCPPQSVIESNFDRNTLRYFDLPTTWTDPCAVMIENLWNRLGNPPLYCGHMHKKVQDRTCRILDINELLIV